MERSKFSKIVKRELEVAFSKNAQPTWLRVLKYVVLGCFIYFFWNSNLFWIILTVVFILSLLLHFWYRFKTEGWTKSYGGSEFDASYNCKQTIDGGFVIVGVINQSGDDNILLIKTDSAGNLLWQKNYGVGGTEYGFTVDINVDT